MTGTGYRDLTAGFVFRRCQTNGQIVPTLGPEVCQYYLPTLGSLDPSGKDK